MKLVVQRARFTRPYMIVTMTEPLSPVQLTPFFSQVIAVFELHNSQLQGSLALSTLRWHQQLVDFNNYHRKIRGVGCILPSRFLISRLYVTVMRHI